MSKVQLKKATITVLFNPTEYSFERSNSYKATPVPGLSSPLLQFVNGESDHLSMDLFLDDYTDPNGPTSLQLKESDPVARLDPGLHPACEEPIVRPQVHLYEHCHVDQGSSAWTHIEPNFDPKTASQALHWPSSCATDDDGPRAPRSTYPMRSVVVGGAARLR